MAKKPPHVYPVPSNIKQIEMVRASKSVTLNSCDFLKESTELRVYQTVGALNMVLLKYMVLGDEPGLGKTLQTLSAYGVIRAATAGTQLMVFTTKSAKGQWGKEIDKFLQGVSYHVLTSEYRSKRTGKKLTGSAAREAQYEEQADVDVFISGYYPLQKEPRKLRTCRNGNCMVVFDEIHLLKNPKSMTYIGADYFLQEGVDRIYGLTATPIKNRLLEFYYLYKLVMPKLFPLVTHFKEEYCDQELKMVPQKGGKPRRIMEVTGYKNLDLFRQRIDPYFLRRTADDVGGELPGILSRKIEFTLSPSQDRLYREAVAGLVYERKVRHRYFEVKEAVEKLEAAGKEISPKMSEGYDLLSQKYEEILSGDFLKNNKNSALAFCQLIVNGPQWLGPDEEGDSAKEEAFEDLLEGEFAGQKMIVYTRFKSGIPRLEAICKKLGVKHTRVTGDENDKQRTAAMQAFQDPDGDVEVIFITDAGSASINLQAASIMLFFDSPWTWGDLVQIVGRARRLNSIHSHVTVAHMVATATIDERVLKVLAGKKDLVNRAVGPQPKELLCFDGVDTVFGDEDYNRSEIDLLFDEVFKVA